ncbi:hypothetical protein HDU92_004885 [Lobulomyces angularis]|nr:hypothetical protein HDU92_004885 [Lobulomyces angularis]
MSEKHLQLSHSDSDFQVSRISLGTNNEYEVDEPLPAFSELEINDNQQHSTSSSNFDPTLNLCSIQIKDSDKFILTNYPNELYQPLVNYLKEVWPDIQEESSIYKGSRKIKFKGTPWRGSGTISNKSRLLVNQLLQFQINNGWKILRSCNIRVISAPIQAEGIVKEVVSSCSPGLQKSQIYADFPEFQINGSPFWSNDDNSIAKLQHLMTYLLESLRNAGYFVYHAVSLSTGLSSGENGGTMKTDTLFFSTGIDLSSEISDTFTASSSSSFNNENTTTTSSSVFSLALYSSDKIYLTNFPNQLYPLFIQTINSNWPEIQQENTITSETRMIKLKGNPWLGRGEDSVSSRLLVTRIFQFLNNLGFKYMTSVDIFKRPFAKDANFFLIPNNNAIFAINNYFEEPNFFNQKKKIFCLSINESDKIRLFDAPKNVIECVSNCIRDHWPGGIQRQRDYAGFPEFKLKGFIWKCFEDNTVNKEIFLIHLIKNLNNIGFEFFCSGNFNCGKSSGGDNAYTLLLDTMLFREI